MTVRTALLASVFVCLTRPAAAASIANTDDKDYKLTVVEAGASRVQTLKPGGVLDGVCPKGCIVRIGDSANDEYELEGADVVSIEDGLLYSDGTAAGGAAKPPAAKP